MFLLKLQQRLKEMEAVPCWENIKAISETEDTVITESSGFPFSLLGFLPLYCQSGTDDLHSAALFQVILFFERRHSTEWPSISQLRIQVSSQQILGVFGDDLVACLWAGSGERREAISALDPAEGMSWLPGSMPDPSARGKDNSLFMHRCNFCHWLDTLGRVFWDYHTSWVIEVRGQPEVCDNRSEIHCQVDL